MLRRQERVVRTLFPWVVQDPRLHLPLEAGGLGYTGRGLAVSVGLRCRFAKLLSRGLSKDIGTRLAGKRAFREECLFPRPLISAPSDIKEWYIHEKRFSWVDLSDVDGEAEVKLSDLVAWKQAVIERAFIAYGGKSRRVRDAGRPARTKREALFGRRLPAPTNVNPLSKGQGGVQAVRRFSIACREQPIRVTRDVSLVIPSENDDSARWTKSRVQSNGESRVLEAPR
jgi:hypothetical protein